MRGCRTGLSRTELSSTPSWPSTTASARGPRLRARIGPGPRPILSQVKLRLSHLRVQLRLGPRPFPSRPTTRLPNCQPSSRGGNQLPRSATSSRASPQPGHPSSPYSVLLSQSRQRNETGWTGTATRRAGWRTACGARRKQLRSIRWCWLRRRKPRYVLPELVGAVLHRADVVAL